jgi:hypothetical protein
VKLVKSIELVLGFVASSGVVLVLSGGAYAATSGVDTISQNVSEISAGTNVEKVSLVESKDSHAEGASEAATPATDPSVIVKDSLSKAEGAVEAIVPTESAARVDKTAVEIKAVKAKDQGTPSFVGNMTPKVEGAAAPVVEKTSVDSSLASPSTNTPDSDISVPASADNTIVLGSRVLEIQPKITTSRPVVIQDLATSMPTAAEQTHHSPTTPAPAKSAGLFSRLTSELAGTVVPVTFAVPALDFISVAIGALMLAIGFLALGFTGMNFGAWMRRSGYVHAARSDVSAGFFSLFATPMSLSFVTAAGPQQSSFLMVSEIKTDRITVFNAYRKEEMK